MRLTPIWVTTLVTAVACGLVPLVGCGEHRADDLGSTSQALAGDGLVISQVYGGTFDGNVYDRGFIELFNRSSAPVSLDGLSVQYQSAPASFDGTETSHIVVLPNVIVPPGGYYLIAASELAGGDPLPTPDLEAPFLPILPDIGKVALARVTTPLPCGTADLRCSPAEVVDMVGYDPFFGGVTDYEGSSPAPGGVRRNRGCTDTNENGVDFVDSAPQARSSASPPTNCAERKGDGLVISQAYVGSGRPNAAFARHFIEIFNRTSAPISMAGLSVQHTTYGYSFMPYEVTVLPDVVLPPGGYFLVGYQPYQPLGGLDFVADLSRPNPPLQDVTGTIALARVTSALGCGGLSCSTDEIVDLVSVSVPTLEGNPLPALSAATAAIRRGDGCTDTDVNSADFDIGPPDPRSSLVFPRPCDPSSVDAGADAGSFPVVDGGAGVVISQVFAGGASSDASVNRDYVELFNRSTEPVSLAGMSLQYGEGTSDFGDDPNRNVLVFPDVVVEGESYFLVALASDDLSTGTRLDADLLGRFQLAPSGGKIALVRTRAPLGCGGSTRCPSTLVVDMVGYGSGTDFEGNAAAPALDSSSAVLRNGKGCIDTNDNGSDFVTGAPIPRTKAAPGVDCALPTLPDEPTVDAGRDAGEPPPAADGGTSADSGAGAPVVDAGFGESRADDSGCSCRSTGAAQAPATSNVVLAAAAAMVFGFRKRRRA